MCLCCINFYHLWYVRGVANSTYFQESSTGWETVAGEYVVEHVLRELHKICRAMSVTLGIAAVQKSAEDTDGVIPINFIWSVWT